MLAHCSSGSSSSAMARLQPVVLAALSLLLLASVLEAEKRPPRVQVYSRYPAENGKPNFINCYVSGFHPPQIKIEILKNGEKMNTEESDLSFSKDWSFYVLVHGEFTPKDGDKYTCRVTHETLKEPLVVQWDPDN